MAQTKISDIETLARQRLVEEVPRFWTSSELVNIIIAGIKDLWRDIADLKQEHFLKINDTDVSFVAEDTVLTGVPNDVHKIYMIEARDLTTTSVNVGIQFKPLDYNHKNFQLARSRSSIDPANDTIYYSITAAGAPVGAPVIYCAPKVNSTVPIRFAYVPSLAPLASDDFVPIPGECDNALIAWCVSYARAKEREDRSPDPGWLAVYQTEKTHLLESLGLRQYQEPVFTDAIFEEYW